MVRIAALPLLFLWFSLSASAEPHTCSTRFRLLGGTEDDATAVATVARDWGRQLPLSPAAAEAAGKKLLAQLPIEPWEGSVEATMASYVGRLHPGKRVQILSPGTPGLSGDPVLMAEVDGKILYALKTYSKRPDALGREVGVQEFVRAREPTSFALPDNLGAFRVVDNGKESAVLVMAAAPGKDLNGHLKAMANGSVSTREAAATFEMVGRALRETHDKFRPWIHRAQDAQDYQAYELKKLKSAANELRAQTRAVNEGWATADELKKLADHTDSVTAAYEAVPPTSLSLAHGDFHLGNVLCESTKCTIIDWQTAANSVARNGMGRVRGTADPHNDLGRLLESLHLVGHRLNLADGEVTALANSFLRGYYQGAQPNEAARVSTVFHRLRYAHIQIGQESRREPREICWAFDTILKQEGIRPTGQQSPCR